MFAHPGYEYIWKIFVYFKCQIHSERLPPQICCFLGFFSTGPKWSSYKVSSLWDQPFYFFCQKMPKKLQYFVDKIFFANFLQCFTN